MRPGGGVSRAGRGEARRRGEQGRAGQDRAEPGGTGHGNKNFFWRGSGAATGDS